MKNSEINSFIELATILAISLISGCQSSQKFEIKPIEGELYTIEIRNSRVSQECYFMNAEKENQWRHQYILYMLTDSNDVIPVHYPINQDKDECLKQVKQVDEILKNTPTVRLCLRGKLEKFADSKTTVQPLDFGPLGKFNPSYEALTFDTICNSKKCLSISDTWTYTCPPFHSKTNK